jgi:arylsulfatase A-like enzyme
METANVDRLAYDGSGLNRLRQPVCSTARAALMTGRSRWGLC